MQKKPFLIAFIIFIISAGLLWQQTIKNQAKNTPQQNTNNIEMKNGTQYITIRAGNGYAPKFTTAKAGVPTKLIVKTNDAYDCSAALALPSINYRKTLSPTGEETIDIGTPKQGTFRGTCSMGMYAFSIIFE